MNKTFIHERENWTDFRWDTEKLQEVLGQVNREAGYLAGRLSDVGFDTLLNTATVTLANDIVSSSAIEGVVLDTDEVRSSVARKLGIEINDEKSSTHYIDGIVEMMLDATANYSSPLTHERLFSWHGALFPTGRSGITEIHVGAYRTDSMQVISGMFGRERVHYRAPEPQRVEAEMENFINWFNKCQPSYIKSAIAHLWFVSIHPFDDGNGRIARAISDMVLAQTENNGRRFYSLSTEINKEKKDYYNVLERTQQGDGDITEWLLWYLKCVTNAVKASYTMLSGVLRKSIFWHTHSQIALSERQKTAINSWLDGYSAKLTVKNYAKLCKISPDTAMRDIQDLQEKGILKAGQGRVRDASYSLIYKQDNNDYGVLSLKENGEEMYIVAALKDGRTIQERVSDIDILRVKQEEITLNDLADKYFSFMKL